MQGEGGAQVNGWGVAGSGAQGQRVDAGWYGDGSGQSAENEETGWQGTRTQGGESGLGALAEEPLASGSASTSTSASGSASGSGLVFPELLTDVSTLAARGYSSLTSALNKRIGQRGSTSTSDKAGGGNSGSDGGGDGSAGGGKKAKGRLCAPEEEKGAYVTSLVGSIDQLWGVRVLAASLRVNGENS